MAPRRSRLTLRIDADALAVIRSVAARLGMTVSEYMVGRALADANTRNEAVGMTDRLDALESAITGAVGDHDARVGEAFDTLATRLAESVRAASDQQYQRINADLHSLNRALFAAVGKVQKQPAPTAVPPQTSKE